MKNLSELLCEYSESGFYPLHMPGHKRNTELLGSALPYSVDITEITGFDDLHAPSGAIERIQLSLSRFYVSERSFLLVNGSTCGIMAAIISVCSFGNKIIVARNCHRSVYKAIELYNLTPVWLMPDMDAETGIGGEITAQCIADAIGKNRDAKLVVVTSPTYEGVISDIRSIADVCHKADIPLLCDMAHGAHLPLFSGYDGAYGADIEITSLHKTLPCLTQTACANIRSERVRADAFAAALQIFETSSPSYILMSSADRCMQLIESRGKELADSHRERIARFTDAVSGMKYLSLVGSKYRSFDHSKLVISCNNTSVSGVELAGILRDKYLIECEMASARYVIGMTSVCDTDEGIMRFADALIEIDKYLSSADDKPFPTLSEPVTVMTAYKAIRAGSEAAENENAVGRICGEYIMAYPPGIPMIAPGEIVTAEALEAIKYMRERNVNILSAHSDKIITVLP